VVFQPLQLLRVFWGIAVLLGLCGYSMVTALGADDSERIPSGRSAALAPVAGFTPAPTPIGGYPTPAPLTIFLACDSHDSEVAPYVLTPGGYVVLRIDNDRELIKDLVAGRSTRFGTVLNLVQTPCVRDLLRSGRFP
jgi:hypothetical protein